MPPLFVEAVPKGWPLFLGVFADGRAIRGGIP